MVQRIRQFQPLESWISEMSFVLQLRIYQRNRPLDIGVIVCLGEVFMKDYYNTFVDLSLQGCKKDDYADKQKVKKKQCSF